MIYRSAWSAAAAALVLTCVSLSGALAADPAVERGKYLVNIAGCNDCHTPGYFLGKPDVARFLSGSEVGFEIPRRLSRPQPDTGQGDRAWRLDRRPDHHCSPEGHDA